MGNSQSSSSLKRGDGENKVIDTPIFAAETTGGANPSESASSSGRHQAPTPTGHEYDLMDQIASDLPSVMVS